MLEVIPGLFQMALLAQDPAQLVVSDCLEEVVVVEIRCATAFSRQLKALRTCYNLVKAGTHFHKLV